MKILTKKKQLKIANLLSDLLIVQANYIPNPDSIKANKIYNELVNELGVNDIFLSSIANRLEESDYTEEKKNAEKSDD